MALWDNLESAMEAPPSPTSASLHTGDKRKHSGDVNAEFSDAEGDVFDTPHVNSSQDTPTLVPGNQNFAALAVRIGSAKRLRAEQQRSLEIFSTDTLRTQNIKLFAELNSITNKLDKIVSSAPTYQVSESLAKNIYSYALGVMFSSKLGAYKGTVPLNHVLNIVKRFRFDLPADIERNPADWSKVVGEVQDVLTQIRSRIKKALRASMKGSTPAEHQNIYELTQDLIARSSCKITVQLCARVALMRAVYVEDSSDRFWNSVDEFLGRIRTKADTPEKLVRAFKHLLHEDRRTHGAATERTLSDEYGADVFQQSVDDTIDGRVQVGYNASGSAPPSSPSFASLTTASTPMRSSPAASTGSVHASASGSVSRASPVPVTASGDHEIIENDDA
ncbi:hypothetical protein FKP32DRAFT_1677703 [Trametes sanguinea]|nr:hypothetical protein FKP32DRAFT_1677703 [Trametes sanguinea]